MSSFQLLWESNPVINYLEEERNILFSKKYIWKNIRTQIFYLKTSLQSKAAGSVFIIPLKTSRCECRSRQVWKTMRKVPKDHDIWQPYLSSPFSQWLYNDKCPLQTEKSSQAYDCNLDSCHLRHPLLRTQFAGRSLQHVVTLYRVKLLTLICIPSNVMKGRESRVDLLSLWNKLEINKKQNVYPSWHVFIYLPLAKTSLIIVG